MQTTGRRCAMHVPDHISATGEPLAPKNYNTQDQQWRDRERVLSAMTVPDRILVAGGDSYVGYRGQPKEVMMDQFLNGNGSENYSLHAVLGVHMPPLDPYLEDLPSQLTLDKHVPDVVEPAHMLHEESMSQASIAIEENPLQELKIMRRQLSRLATRLYQLEDDHEKRRTREVGYLMMMAGFAAALLFALVRK